MIKSVMVSAMDPQPYSEENAAESVPSAPPVATPVAAPPPLAAPSRVRLPSSVVTSLIVMVVGGSVAALAIPHLDAAVTGTGGTPSIISFGGMAIVAILLTGMVLRVAAKAGLGLSQRWLALALLYNSLIVVVKFLLAPLALYLTNQQTSFQNLGWAGNANSLTYFIFIAAAIGVLYMGVFFALRKVAEHKVHISRNVVKNLSIVAALIIIAGFITGGAILLIPLFLFGFNFLAYVGYIFSSPLAYLLVTALVAAAAAAWVALRQSVRDEAASGQTVSTASFFVLGIALIAVYHFLWIVYMISLVSLWPFKTYTPK